MCMLRQRGSERGRGAIPNAISGGADAGARWRFFRLRRVRRVRTRSAAKTGWQDVGCCSPRFGSVLVSRLRGLGLRAEAVLTL